MICGPFLFVGRAAMECWYTSFGTSLPSVVFALEHFLAEILALAECSRQGSVGKDGCAMSDSKVFCNAL